MEYFSILLISLLLTCCHSDQILLNPGFEEPFTADDWYSVSCQLTQHTDAYRGNYSAKVDNRNADWASVRQDVSLDPDTNYYFSMYVKLLEVTEGSMWNQVDLFVLAHYTNGSDDYIWSGRLPYLRSDQGWQKIGGDFKTQQIIYSGFTAYLKVSSVHDQHLDYLVDEASLTAFYRNVNWKEEAKARIDDIRKNDVTVNVIISSNYEPENIEVEIQQKTQSFPFGSAVTDAQVAGDTDYNLRYQDTFYSNFNWAVLENDLKWTRMEPERGEINFPDESINRLNQRRVPVRGHCVFWGKEDFVPDWLKELPAEEVEQEIQRRIDYVVTRYQNQLIHWDVNNEQLHGSWFEETLGNPTYLNNMFNDVRSRDSNAVLFINDYQVVTSSGFTQAIVNSAIEVNSSTGHMGALGIQSHINGYPDITAIQRRLDEISVYGYPMWVTELSIDGLQDREQRADAYDDLVTLYYSHPGVKGVLLWGFSDNHHPRPDCALFEGDYFEPNAAGRRWQEMMLLRWRSYETFYPQSNNQTFGFRGFHGDYQIQVRYNGELIMLEEFNLLEGQDITVDVDVNNRYKN